ncbi:HAUS augmin-like complex subunit 6 N-terminus-domain-containing protein [Dendryphion nanum]|uniref:HAUS augmin-like complex subunit 6 N-terminus-domain-containing protein n=1 Tax=Dendryphion nanum TaxID=256645 RepID=A0A9P9IIP8_9PLEO|nr:HAUS augmin-like complex subunit 6 N-terminus-domain-containing protein [Dendryphion nanum]
MSRPTSQSTNTSTTTTTSAPARSLSVKAGTKSSQNNNNPFPASDARLFVTNLRLLDLDQQSDWPNITVQTLSSKNADQKQRIGGVEWALFRLFEIWDPEETNQKLRPFFPPLEPLQSLNLRAALYRCLNELKKNGVLGRESVLRKTMLDECKGERFFEILAVFSTIVLKKELAIRLNDRRKIAVARQLSTTGMMSLNNQASLLPLAIAHKAALTKVLRQKNEKRKRYKEFEARLDEKNSEINQKLRQSKATPRSRKSLIPDNETAAIKKQLFDNWVGDHRWLDVILRGDNVEAEDAFLNRRFDQVWQMVEQGRNPEEAASDVGLLENLQSRVQEQQTRLQKWRQFSQQMQKDSLETRKLNKKSESMPKDFAFDDHLQLQLPATKSNTERTALPLDAQLRAEYQDIISDMDAELNRVLTSKQSQTVPLLLSRRTSSFSTSRSPARRKKSTSELSSKKSVKPASPSRKRSTEKIPVRPVPAIKQKPLDHVPRLAAIRHEPTSTPLDSEATLIGPPSTSLRNVPSLPPPSQPTSQTQYDDFEEPSDVLPPSSSPPHVAPTERSPSPSPSPTPLGTPYIPSEPPLLTFEPPLQTHEEALADQIISSIGNATPSPIKKPQPRMSLLERTRMSMAGTSFAPISEQDSPSLPTLPSPPSSSLEPPAPLQNPTLDRRTSLLDRTRLSMAAMTSRDPSHHQTQAQKQKAARKSLRQSQIFPVNQFDTPRNRRSFQAIEEARSSAGATTPKEILFSEDAEYDRVFKSRPRIAQSPIFTPEAGGQKLDFEAGNGEENEGIDGEDGAISYEYSGDEGEEDEFDEGVTGVDLADVDRDSDGDDGFTKNWEDSPLRRAGGDIGEIRGLKMGRGRGKLF